MMRQSQILVVDDEPDVAGLLVALLQSDGYRTALATTGNQALDFVSKEMPAAVVLDLSLPDIDGVQVLHLLKGHVQTAAVPVIIVSAYTGRLSAADKLLTAAIFEKPFDLDALSATVGHLSSISAPRKPKACGPTRRSRAPLPAISAV